MAQGFDRSSALWHDSAAPQTKAGFGHGQVPFVKNAAKGLDVSAVKAAGAERPRYANSKSWHSGWKNIIIYGSEVCHLTARKPIFPPKAQIVFATVKDGAPPRFAPQTGCPVGRIAGNGVQFSVPNSVGIFNPKSGLHTRLNLTFPDIGLTRLWGSMPRIFKSYSG